MSARLPCTCGTELEPVAWRAHSKSYRYRLRCPRCGLKSVVASVRPEAAVELWNEAVVLKRDLRRRGQR
jgi:DNA-directed RNA polymerase subunit RPC12/RpoP